VLNIDVFCLLWTASWHFG